MIDYMQLITAFMVGVAVGHILPKLAAYYWNKSWIPVPDELKELLRKND